MRFCVREDGLVEHAVNVVFEEVLEGSRKAREGIFFCVSGRSGFSGK